jgi:hypothetical protein
MDQQTTFRLPRTLAKRLADQAKRRGVPKSLVVREALEAYLGVGVPVGGATLVREAAPEYLGSLALDREAVASDPVAAMIRERNWRE